MKWKKIERRNRRGSRSEETLGALCSARLLVAAVATVVAVAAEAAASVNTIVLDDRDRVDNEIGDRRYDRGFD